MVKSPLITILFVLGLTFIVLLPLLATASQNNPPPSPNYILKPGNHYFMADWCKYCKEQGIDIQKLRSQGYIFEVYHQKYDPEIFKNLNIKAIPMIIIVKVDEKGRQIIIRLKGKQPIKKLVKVLIK